MFQAPYGARMPSLPILLDALPTQCPKTIARHLGCSVGTLERWKRTGDAPRAVMLALFWETRYGQATVNAHAENAARVHAGHARALEDAANRFKLKMSVLVHTRAANTDRYGSEFLRNTAAVWTMPGAARQGSAALDLYRLRV